LGLVARWAGARRRALGSAQTSGRPVAQARAGYAGGAVLRRPRAGAPPGAAHGSPLDPWPGSRSDLRALRDRARLPGRPPPVQRARSHQRGVRRGAPPPPAHRARPGRSDRGGALGGPGQVRQGGTDGGRMPARHRHRRVVDPAYAPPARHRGESGMIPDALTFAHPWALLGLLAAAAAAWLLHRRRRSLPRLVLPETGSAAGIPPSRWARLWWLPGG